MAKRIASSFLLKVSFMKYGDIFTGLKIKHFLHNRSTQATWIRLSLCLKLKQSRLFIGLLPTTRQPRQPPRGCHRWGLPALRSAISFRKQYSDTARKYYLK